MRGRSAGRGPVGGDTRGGDRRAVAVEQGTEFKGRLTLKGGHKTVFEGRQDGARGLQ